ncbi:MAG TPA: glycoside hydrolase family 25 protein [Candidatus Saccharimonadales bacterium]|nr:glycoside hydrolase family 25 protein [Candidatus Saccharimonadales bacterium]
MKKQNVIIMTTVLAAGCLATSSQASQVLGIDVSDYQGTVNWTSVHNSGVKWAFAKATEGYLFSEQSHYHTNMTSGKAAGVLMGAYHFSHPRYNTPAQEASYFWNFASPNINNDSKSLDSMVDFERYSGTLNGESYTSFFNDWGSDVKGKTTVFNRPVVYSSAGSGMCDLATSCTLSAWVANYNGEGYSTGNPWTCCDSCNFVSPGTRNNWTYWQCSSTLHIGGIVCDCDAYAGTSATELEAYQGIGK